MSALKGFAMTAAVTLAVLAAWHYLAPASLKAHTGTV